MIQHLQKVQMRLRMQGSVGGRQAKDHAEADISVQIKKTESQQKAENTETEGGECDALAIRKCRSRKVPFRI